LYRRFEDLKVWQMGRQFRNEIYKVTKKFPKEETFNLILQIRRAALSITSNLAEGHGRYHFQETMQFCRTSRGSLNEVIDQLYLALDMSYINKSEFDDLYCKGREVEKVLNGYIAYLEKNKVKSHEKK